MTKLEERISREVNDLLFDFARETEGKISIGEIATISIKVGAIAAKMYKDQINDKA